MKSSFLFKSLISGCVIFFCSILIICFACFSLIVISQYDPKQLQYGKSFNSERMKMGIPIIPNDWFSVSNSGKTIWQNPIWHTTTRTYGDGGEPLIIHYQKIVVVQSENTIEETDVYVGDALEILTEVVILEKVEIICVYNPDNLSNKKCSTNIKTRQVVYSGEDIDKAIQILSEWNIPYP